ncbi:uncharacterized protein LOC122043702 [Zingiber officinale]|uniref:uncharacterized protein LOC122043702 n=1 Tax=Zingiber officinale TaxID=94328 RepID=UPI001C4DCEEB|nr:uncharacterized protein LOC122043702 [Zingiber officinale]
MLPFPNPNPNPNAHTLSIPFTSTDLIEIDPFPSISNSSFVAISPCIDILPFDAIETTTVPQLDPLLVVANYTSPPLMMRRRPADKVRGPRKDRHSKIVTAKGPRDRRIRLSREVARNFFDLQEMLGFEHGSKTVQWLLTMSKHAIQELNTTTSPFIIRKNDCKGKAIATTLSYPSESIEEEQRQVAIEAARVIYNNNNNEHSDNNHIDTSNYEMLISKESRAQARERARNTTTQKKLSKGCVPSSNIAPTIGAAKVDLHLTELRDQEGSSAQCSVHLGFTAEEGRYFGMVPIYDCWTGENNSMEDISFQEQDIWRLLVNDI